MKKRVAVIGAGLSGSLMSALLRNDFKVTLIEQRKQKRPLFNDIECPEGEVTTSINRAEGLGGTTNYWHNALIELDDKDLKKAGIDQPSSPTTRRRGRSSSRMPSSPSATAHGMPIAPTSKRVARPWPTWCCPRPATTCGSSPTRGCRAMGSISWLGGPRSSLPGEGDASGHVLVKAKDGVRKIEADYFLVCAGGLSTPALLANSLDAESTFCEGYHDHPMAYVAKIRLRPESRLKAVSCTTTQSSEVRAGDHL